ncbi:ABC transporter permease [Luteirhabdus pelagi]|uniref:ABC transporter permease n=1 Tax=Luteirhabdus pelagi TaxID=2792783 RepID=UPI00293D816D|nr:ABC transporter permease [Luteirhabdus pelagi]
MNTNPNNESWLYEISAKRKVIDLNFKEIWQYRDLLMLFVKRDIVTVYKQTVLGPLWFFIQPLFTSVIFTLVFNSIAKIETGLVPAFLFNLSGITAWNYFKVCLMGTSSTFRANAGLFGKVYFPRFIVPLSKVISNLVKFGIQMTILAGFYIYYISTGADIALSGYTLLFPVFLLLMILYGLGAGMIISTLTTKYRDISLLLTFFVQLLMYVSAVPYPMKALTNSSYGWVVAYNPLAYIMEGFRFILFNDGSLYFDSLRILFIALGGVVLFIVGLALFNRTEKTFIDTV